MLYYSTNKLSPKVNFRDATIKGQAPDKGLYFPEHLPTLPADFIRHIDLYSKEEIAYTAIQPFVGDSIPKQQLEKIIADTVFINFPLVSIDNRISSLELFHGPTLAFKDVGARFMSRCLGYFVQNLNRQVTVLVATSGDTGGAVASGFYDVEGVNVVILYPSGKVSSVQELQLTTLGKNITAIEINGNFDDCQKLVKEAFADSEVTEHRFLTSANSINVARWLPQQFYYFFAYQQWADKQKPPVFCVPSGNFGNICAGLVAHLQGLPVAHFVAAVNANDTVLKYLQTGNYQSQDAITTVSNAMDVGNPSNFIRILELFQHQYPQVVSTISSFSISDHQTIESLKHVYNQYHYLLDPHGAVAYTALQQYLLNQPEQKGIILETAHPIKFYDVVEPVIRDTVPAPDGIEALKKRHKVSIKMTADYKEFKQFLLS